MEKLGGKQAWQAALHTLLITLAPSSRRFCRIQANAWLLGPNTMRATSFLARTMPEMRCRQAADKPAICHRGRLRPHYATLRFTARLVSSCLHPSQTPIKPLAHTKSLLTRLATPVHCLAFAWLPLPRLSPLPRYSALVHAPRELAARCLRPTMANTSRQGLGEGPGVLHVERVRCLEKMVHRPCF